MEQQSRPTRAPAPTTAPATARCPRRSAAPGADGHERRRRDVGPDASQSHRRPRSDARNGAGGRGGSSDASSAASATRAEGTSSKGLAARADSCRAHRPGSVKHGGGTRIQAPAQIAFVGREGQRPLVDVVERRRSARLDAPSPRTVAPSRRAHSPSVRKAGSYWLRRRRLLGDLENLLDVGRDVDPAVAR